MDSMQLGNDTYWWFRNIYLEGSSLKAREVPRNQQNNMAGSVATAFCLNIDNRFIFYGERRAEHFITKEKLKRYFVTSTTSDHSCQLLVYLLHLILFHYWEWILVPHELVVINDVFSDIFNTKTLLFFIKRWGLTGMCFLGDTAYHLQKRNIITAEESL